MYTCFPVLSINVISASLWWRERASRLATIVPPTPPPTINTCLGMELPPYECVNGFSALRSVCSLVLGWLQYSHVWLFESRLECLLQNLDRWTRRQERHRLVGLSCRE